MRWVPPRNKKRRTEELAPPLSSNDKIDRLAETTAAFGELKKKCKVYGKQTNHLSKATSKSLQVHQQDEKRHELEYEKKNDAIMKCGELESKIRATDFEIAELVKIRSQTEDELLKNREIAMSEGVAHAHVACLKSESYLKAAENEEAEAKRIKALLDAKLEELSTSWRLLSPRDVFELLDLPFTFDAVVTLDEHSLETLLEAFKSFGCNVVKPYALGSRSHDDMVTVLCDAAGIPVDDDETEGHEAEEHGVLGGAQWFWSTSILNMLSTQCSRRARRRTAEMGKWNSYFYL